MLKVVPDPENGAPKGAPTDDDILRWALAYLRGRLKSFRRGNLTENHVRGAIRAALERSVSMDKIRKLLVEYAPDLDVNLASP